MTDTKHKTENLSRMKRRYSANIILYAVYQFKTVVTPKLNGNILYVEGDKATLALHRFLKASAYLNKTFMCDREALFLARCKFCQKTPYQEGTKILCFLSIYTKIPT